MLMTKYLILFLILLINRYNLANFKLINYTINLMWINQKPELDQQYILPTNHLLQAVICWARKNPKAQINLWFDSELTNQQAILNTSNFIRNQPIKKTSFRKHKAKINNIYLKDIRELKIVKKNASVFSPQVPIYFRADLLRAIIAKELITKNNDRYFVYTDLDVTPLGKNKIFDNKTVLLLDQYGFVLSYAHNKPKFENGFQIFKYAYNLAQAIEIMIIQTNILRAQSFLEQDLTTITPQDRASLQENVFRSYPLMLSYLLNPNPHSELNISPNASELNVSISKLARIYDLQEWAFTQLKSHPMPIKKITRPKSQSYNFEIINS